MSKEDPYYMSLEEVEAHEKFMEEVRQADPKESCDMIRAWMKLNIEASMTPVWKN
jgi:hypothetical protein